MLTEYLRDNLPRFFADLLIFGLTVLWFFITFHIISWVWRKRVVVDWKRLVVDWRIMREKIKKDIENDKNADKD